MEIKTYIHVKVDGIEQYGDYRAYLNAVIERNRGVKGYRTRLSKVGGFHPSFLSQVLTSNVQITPDHAARLCEFWGMSQSETEYFLALVHLERAASNVLREILKKTIQKLRIEKSNSLNLGELK